MSKAYNLSKLPSGVLRLHLSSECGIFRKKPYHRTLIATVCLLVLASSQRVALAAGPREIEVTWSELSPLITGQNITLVLDDSTRIHGKVHVFREDALVIGIDKTSNRQLHPPSQGTIPRFSVSAIELHETRPGRLGQKVGAKAGAIGGIALGIALAAVPAGRGSLAGASTVFFGGIGGGALAGYLIGRHFDQKITRIKIAPETRGFSENPDPSPSGSDRPHP
jgi:hypothetical protein